MSAYPNIARACQLIALDNGGINRARGAFEQVRQCERWTEDRAQFRFPNIDELDAWLATLTDEQLDSVCCGGEGESDKVAAMAGAPPFADELLTTYFEEVC